MTAPLMTAPLMAMLFALWAPPANSADAPWLPSDHDQFSQGEASAVSSQPWWETFGDADLRSIMEEGLGDSFDLRSARARLQQAEALSRGALAPMAPSLSFDVSTATSPTDSLGFGFGSAGGAFSAGIDQDFYHTGSAEFSASWRPDIFGRTWLGYRSSRFSALATAGDADAAAIALTTRIGQAWYELIAARNRLDIVQQQVQTNQDLLDLTQRRFASAEVTGLDVLQQRQQLAASQALLPQARILLRAQQQQLNVLLGRPPSTPLPAPPQDFPALSQAPAVGQPIDLIDNRPDLRAARARLAGAQADRNNAVRALLPSLQVGARAGWQGSYFDELDTQPTWGVNTTLSVPLFGGGASHAGISAARAGESIAATNVSQSVLSAMAEVEDALVRDHEQQILLEATLRREDAARQAYKEARNRYVTGVDSYLVLLSALSSYQQSQLDLLSARRDRVVARINLHDALGGAWTHALSGRTNPANGGTP